MQPSFLVHFRRTDDSVSKFLCAFLTINLPFAIYKDSEVCYTTSSYFFIYKYGNLFPKR